MVLEPNATMQRAPPDNQLMSKHRVLSFKPQLSLELVEACFNIEVSGSP
jgi:hypothetical protein